MFRHKSDAALPMVAFVEGEDEDAQEAARQADQGQEPSRSSTSSRCSALPVSDYARVLGPDAKKVGTLTEPRQFNLMFKTYVGALQSEDNIAYLRPETAQGIFLNFKNVVDTTRVKVPFGIAQIGKAFRNEVTPRNFIFRSREFEQMEIEWFCHPDEAQHVVRVLARARAASGGTASASPARTCSCASTSRTSSRTTPRKARARSTSSTASRSPGPGFGELEGVAHRGDFDLQPAPEASPRPSSATSTRTRSSASCRT